MRVIAGGAHDGDDPLDLGRIRRIDTSGIAAADETPTANIYDLVDGKISRIRIFTDRAEALEAAGLPTSE